jgi:glutamine synthetase
MMVDSANAVLERLADDGVKYILGAYVDVHGVPKAKAVPIRYLESAAAGSEHYTVGAMDGMGTLGPHEDECQGFPDLGQLTVLPWDRRFAIAPTDLKLHGLPYDHDSRGVLKRQLAMAAELGYSVNVGIEPEIYVLREVDGDLLPLVEDDLRNAPTRGYDIESLILASSFTEPMIDYMDELGWDVYSYVHEGGNGQFEFEFKYTDALLMADRMMLFRLLAKHVARSLGCIATCMPKPFSDGFGSGAHINISLADRETGENRFSGGQPDATDPAELYSDAARNFTAGVLAHAGAVTAVACSTVNSYKRLLPRGLMNEISWAPVFSAYGHNNRTLMCRLPASRQCLEVRICDMAANFYLAIAITLAAGLEGVREKLDPGQPVAVDTYQLTEAELEAAQIRRLPGTLGEAIEQLAADSLARQVFGDGFHASYVAYKREEWRSYNTVVSAWEREQYLHRW